MAVIQRIGRVTIQEKKGYLYLRATLPQPHGITKSQWLSTGLSFNNPDHLPLVISKAKDLDNDIDRWLIGFPFPFHKWQSTQQSLTKKANSIANKLNSSLGSLGSLTGNQVTDLPHESHLTLLEIWDGYMSIQLGHLKLNTRSSYKTYRTALLTMETHPLPPERDRLPSLNYAKNGLPSIQDDSPQISNPIPSNIVNPSATKTTPISSHNIDPVNSPKTTPISSPKTDTISPSGEGKRRRSLLLNNSSFVADPSSELTHKKGLSDNGNGSFLKIDNELGKRVLAWLQVNRAKHSIKLYLRAYKRAIDYAMQSEQFRHNLSHLTLNPFDNLVYSIPRKPSNPIDYFTPIERDLIIEAFLSGSFANSYLCPPHIKQVSIQSHYLYGLYTQLLFLTGCRLNEASALRWSDINLDARTICFQNNIVSDRHSHYLQPSLKSQQYRIFPINNQLFSLLTSIKDSCYNNNDNHVDNQEGLLFTTHKGTYFKTAIYHRVFGKLLGHLGIRYRKPHCIRKTFITQCLEKGIPVATIAQWVGNKPEVIYKHYSGIVSIDVPEL